MTLQYTREGRPKEVDSFQHPVSKRNQMQDLANTVTVRTTFALEEPDPIEASITVTVNGQTATGWTYDPNTNSVVFDENSIPEPSQTIIIEYGIWGC